MTNSNPIFEQAMSTQRNVASFMLRFTQDLWQDENGEPKVQWRGHINHVQGEEEIPFTDFTEALLFMQNQLQELTRQAFPADPQAQEKALKESFKLWEQFAANYANLILQSMEKTIQHSQEIQGQVGDAFTKTFQLWMPPAFRGEKVKGQDSAGDQQSPSRPGMSPEVAQQLETLTAQVQTLAAKVDLLGG